MNLLIKSFAGLVFLIFAVGIALAVRNFYLWHQDLVGPHALPLAAGALWLAHQIGLMLVVLVAAVGTFAKRWWGADALAIVLLYSTFHVLYRLLWVDTTLLLGRTPEVGYTAGLLVVYVGIGYWLLKKNAATYYGISLTALRVGAWLAASVGLLLFDLYA
jgi:hypothetical protein